jgi:hypothetical protein
MSLPKCNESVTRRSNVIPKCTIRLDCGVTGCRKACKQVSGFVSVTLVNVSNVLCHHLRVNFVYSSVVRQQLDYNVDRHCLIPLRSVYYMLHHVNAGDGRGSVVDVTGGVLAYLLK